VGTEIKVWQLTDGQLQEIQNDDLAATHHEKDLEDWIARDPSLLGSPLLVMGRQYEIPDVGRLDLLCIDETGTLVIIEFKRDLTNREAVAQILDYASWLDAASEEEISACARAYLNKPLPDAFDEQFDKPLQSITPQNHRMLLVAPRLDSSAERIINYLAERHEININAVFFRYAKTAQGDEVLIRTVLVPDTVRGVSPARTMTEAELLKMADDHNTRRIVEICRRLSSTADEECAPTDAPSPVLCTPPPAMQRLRLPIAGVGTVVMSRTRRSAKVMGNRDCKQFPV
jgi:endonuclease NucS-like protein